MTLDVKVHISQFCEEKVKKKECHERTISRKITIRKKVIITVPIITQLFCYCSDHNNLHHIEGVVIFKTFYRQYLYL